MKTAVVEAIRRLQQNRVAAGVVLLTILTAHLSLVLALNPPSLFGLSQDDTLYFSSAKALSEGRGYILPSLPGTPAATKYPVLYPWLLSLVWKLDANFPANLWGAVALTYAFSVAAIVLTYLFCRSLEVPRLQSLGVTGFFALHPTFIFYSARVMTDVPFTALALCLLVIARQALRKPSLGWSCLAGIACSLCIAMRLAGIAFLGAILLVFLSSRVWRRALVFFASCAPGIAYFCYQTWMRLPSPPPAPFTPDLPGWQQTWFYYTSYTSFRHLDSPNLHAAATLFLNQILYLISAIAGYFTAPLCEGNIALWFLGTALIGALIVLATAQCVTEKVFLLEIGMFVIYAGLLSAWDYVEWPRFLLPFLPLIVMMVTSGVWRQYKALRVPSTGWVQTAFLALFLAGAIGMSSAVAWNFFREQRLVMPEVRFAREITMPEKLEAYDWIRKHVEPGERLIATEDGLAYLYTGRTFINFTVLMPYDVYDQPRLTRDLDHMSDVGRAVGARYWVITTGDSFTQLQAMAEPLKKRLDQWGTSLPTRFRSSSGNVRVLALDCASLTGSVAAERQKEPAGSATSTIPSVSRPCPKG